MSLNNQADPKLGVVWRSAAVALSWHVPFQGHWRGPAGTATVNIPAQSNPPRELKGFAVGLGGWPGPSERC